MEDIIDIIVTETTNTIEITSQSTDEVIDVNIIDNREDITLNVTPTVVEININSLTGSFGVAWGEITGTLSAQTDLNTTLGLKADLVGGKVPSSQLPSYVDDVIEVANYAALPATGETGKIYVILDTNKIYRWSGSVYVEIADSTAVWGAITGTLSSQTDLQSALNAKFDDPTGDTTQYIAGDGSLVTFPIAGQAGTLVREVRNTTGATLTKGTVVYISGATGNKPTVSKALATGDSTSAQTFGLCQANIANNSNGYVVCVGDIVGLDTSAISEGVQLYLSSTTAGTYTTTKQVAPAHLVYIGVVTRSHPTQGQIEVKIQNGYELDEIHDVLITSKANNDGLFYESSTSLWKNKSIATVLGYSPEQPLTFNSPLSRSSNAVSIPAATSLVNGYLTSADWTTFNAKQSALSFSGPLVLSGSTVYISTASSAQNGYLSAADWTTFNSKQAALSGTGFVKISGTTISYDSSTYVDNANNQSIAGVKTFTTSLHASGLRFSESGGFGNVAGFTQIGGTADYFNFVNGTNTKSATFTYPSGGYTYALPASSGTLALTSALSSYLPLSGGTLTGALSGTSATFSGILYATANIVIGSATNTNELNIYATTSPTIKFQNSGADRGKISSNSSALVYNSLTGNGHNFQIDGVDKFTLAASTGAATFSSSVTAGGFIKTETYFNAGSGSAKLIGVGSAISGGFSSTDMLVYNTGGDLYLLGTGGAGIIVKASSGNVGIGTTAPAYLLDLWSTSATLRIRNTTAPATGGTSSLLFEGINNFSGVSQSFINSIQAGNSGATQLVFGTSGTTDATATERMRITSGGNVLIGTTSDNGNKFRVTASSGWTTEIINNNASNQQLFTLFTYGSTGLGSIQGNGSIVSYYSTSDYRLKEDLKSINGLEIVNKINVYDYKWKASENRMDGVLAHELQEILPYAVSGVKDGKQMQQVDYSKIVPVMVQAIKELKAKIETLENK
jgi:hypothetical protein